MEQEKIKEMAKSIGGRLKNKTSKDKDLRVKNCKKKKSFKKKKYARNHLKFSKAISQYRIYRCNVCGWFHFTKQKQ